MKITKIIQMKKTLLIFLISVITIISVPAQDKEKEGGFKKENLFTGGDVTVSFFNGVTVLGTSPYFGYSLNRFIDVAVSANVNYTSQRDYLEFGDKARQFVYGPGAFVRIFPLNMIFAQAQYEHNFIKFKYLPANNGNFLPSEEKLEANSLLVGGGYCGGRQPGNNSYYYLSVLWDVTKVANSPYVDGIGRNFPIFRAGYNIALFQGRR